MAIESGGPFLPLQFPIGKFRPVSIYFDATNEIQCLTQDVSVSEGYLGETILRPELDSSTDRMVGFRLGDAKHLRSQKKATFMPRILWRALREDLTKPRRLSISVLALIAGYRQAFWLLLRHPRAWFLKK